MVAQEPHDPATPDPSEDNDLAKPVPPPSGLRRPSGERHLTRRVIAPLALLVVAVPVVALLLFNLRDVSDDSSPASAGTSATPTPSAEPSATATTSESPSATASETATPSETPTPSTTPTPVESGPQVTSVTPASGAAAGGQVVVLRGDDLDPVTQVLFGALNGANLQHVSSSEVRVTTPPAAVGTVAVQVKSGADDVRSSVRSYQYR